MMTALHALAAVLDALGLPYYVGGSIASSIHGVMRATADIDVVARLQRGDGRRLVASLAEDCHGDAESACPVHKGKGTDLAARPLGFLTSLGPAHRSSSISA
jgi:hypothetical protein